MNVFPLLLAAGGLFLLTKGKSKSSSKKKIDEKPQNKRECTENQFFKDGVCHTFWDRKSESIVRAALIEKMDGDTSICLSIEELGEYKDNPKMIELITSVVSDLWKIDQVYLPPNESSEKWVQVVWDRTQKIFYRDICKIYSPYG